MFRLNNGQFKKKAKVEGENADAHDEEERLDQKGIGVSYMCMGGLIIFLLLSGPFLLGLFYRGATKMLAGGVNQLHGWMCPVNEEEVCTSYAKSNIDFCKDLAASLKGKTKVKELPQGESQMCSNEKANSEKNSNSNSSNSSKNSECQTDPIEGSTKNCKAGSGKSNDQSKQNADFP